MSTSHNAAQTTELLPLILRGRRNDASIDANVGFLHRCRPKEVIHVFILTLDYGVDVREDRKSSWRRWHKCCYRCSYTP